MDAYFNLENLQTTVPDEQLAKRLKLAYDLMAPMRAIASKYDPEVLALHNRYNEQFVGGLKSIKDWYDYDNFLQDQLVEEEKSRLAICALMHPTERKKQNLPAYAKAQIDNVSNIWGDALAHLLQSEIHYASLRVKHIDDYSNFSVGDEANLKGLEGFLEKFSAGCDWAVEDNVKVAKAIAQKFEVRESSFEDFVEHNGFDFVRYPYRHDSEKNEFLSYLDVCCTNMAAEYGISRTKLGFGQNGLELSTTNQPAFYMPSTKCISLRLDMINAFYHEHFHALDHQILLGIDLEKIKKMYGGRGSLQFNLASDIKLLEPEEIEDGAAKNILLEFNRLNQNIVAQKDEEGKEVVLTEQEQDVRKAHIVVMTERFLQEIYQKLELEPEKFNPTIKEIMVSFSELKKTPEFEKVVEEKLKGLIDEKFKESHVNYYAMMTSRIHHLYNHINNKTLYYNFSLISDNGRENYFATKPEMLARSAESYFFDKFPETNITPPEWWENNSYLFYPQNEEKEAIVKSFKEAVGVISANSAAFEENLGKKNVKKAYKL